MRDRARSKVTGVRYRGASRAEPAPGVIDAITGADVVIVAPSNPFVSIGPILAVPGIRRALRSVRARTIAVSPLIGGRAVKGPLAGMLKSMGHTADAAGIAAIYRGLIDTLIVAPGDLPKKAGDRRGPRLVEHDILIGDVARARRTARFALATALADR